MILVKLGDNLCLDVSLINGVYMKSDKIYIISGEHLFEADFDSYPDNHSLKIIFSRILRDINNARIRVGLSEIIE